MKPTKIAASIALASLFAGAGAMPAFAANDGSLGATSQGDLDVIVDIPKRVQIQGLNDIDLGSYGGTGDLDKSDAFCVYSNAGGLYDLTTTSTNPDGNTFRVTDGASFLPYSVVVNDDTDPAGGQTVDHNQTLTSLTGSSTSATCGGGTNASLEVTFAEADLQGALAGTYTDTITLLVEPN